MRVRLISAESMSAAMAAARRDYGEDVLILASRALARGAVELTVALDAQPQEDAFDPGCGAAFDDGFSPLSAPATVADGAWHGCALPGLDAARTPDEAAAILARHVRFGSLDLSPAAPPPLFCGLPGVGKTLTVTRMATRLVLAGADPVVVTTDMEGAGAFEQLAACTRILGVELHAAHDAQGLAALKRKAGSGRTLLIDTAACVPWEAAAADTLSRLRDAVGGRLTLVHAVGGHAQDMREMVGRFHALGTDALIATRLDCARRLGDLVLAGTTGCALAEASASRRIVEGSFELNPAVLHRLMVEAQARDQPQAAEKGPGPGLEDMEAILTGRAGRIVSASTARQPGRKAAQFPAGPDPSMAPLLRQAAPMARGADVLTRHIQAQGQA